MSCDEYTESLNALLDGELPPEQAALLAAHIAGCPACARTLAELAELRAGLAGLLPPQDAPAALQSRIETLLASPTNIVPLRRRSWNRAGWATSFALAAMLAVALLPRHDETKDLMSVRDAALRPSLASNSNTAPAPLVPGFTLTGNRSDDVAGHNAQVASYTRAGQNFTLCIWPANGEPAHGVKQASYKGMNIEYWNDGDHEYWAASTTPGPNLQNFVTLLAAS